MNSTAVLFAGRLSPEAFEPVSGGKHAVALACERALAFPDVDEVVLLALPSFSWPNPPAGVSVETRPSWGKRSLLSRLSELSEGKALLYFAWADAPFLDPSLAGRLRNRHLKYGAEYSYADGFPYGFAPELLSPGTAGSLCYLAGEDEGRVERDLLFSVLQKDINSFDIETELSAVDLRCHRLSLVADSKRNLLLLNRWAEASGGIPEAVSAQGLISDRPELLRTLPAFYAIQVSGPCAQACPVCPYPRFASSLNPSSGATPFPERQDFLELGAFEALLDRIVAFSGDAVIDLSLWGEVALHPRVFSLVEAVLSRPALSLVLETSGLGWEKGALNRLKELSSRASPRLNGLSPLILIVSLDSNDPERYQRIRGEGWAEAQAFALEAVSLFPDGAYIQALRLKGAEEDTEAFYRAWKEKTANVIIQKYDDFCGALDSRKAADLSPVQRKPCWHLMRDMNILLDGRVLVCREELSSPRELGNALSEDLDRIWERGEALYLSHARQTWPGICERCDEYYSYNF